MKKYLIVFLVVLMSTFAIGVSAQNPSLNVILNTAEDGNDQIILEISNAPGGALMGIVIFKEGEIPVFLENQRANEVKETITFNLTPSDNIHGSLKAKVAFSGSDVLLEKEFWYYSYPEQQAAISAVMNSQTPAEEIINQKEVLGLDLEGMYTKASNKTAIATRLVNTLRALDNVNAAKFNEVFNECVLIEVLNEADTALLKEIIEDDLTGFEQYTTEFEWYTDADDKNSVISSLLEDSYDSIDEFNEALKISAFLDKLNSIHVKEMIEILEYADGKYQNGEEIFDLDFEAYNDLSKAKKDYFAKQLGEEYKSLDDVIDAFDAALKAAEEYDEDKKESSGGGSGGGGGGGFKTPIAKVTDELNTVVSDSAFKFDDIENVSWAKEAIETFAKAGIVSGTGDNKFEPNNNVTREQFVKMLLGTFNISVNNPYQPKSFSDVDGGGWYYSYVQTAVSMGLASGYGDSFGIGDSITREDMAVMLYKAAGLKGVAIEAKGETSPADYAQISDYAKESVDALYKAGIINGVGDGNFAPKAKATRAQAVKLLFELWRVAE